MADKILVIGLCILLLSGCIISNPQQASPNDTATASASTAGYPGPVFETIPTRTSSYPEPAANNNSPSSKTTQEYFVNGLVVPKPLAGKAVVTGILLNSSEGSQPFLTSIYLSVASATGTTEVPPLNNPSEQANLIAIEDISTGQFVFSNVAPGQYRLEIWSQTGDIALTDQSGNAILVDVSAGEVKDVGIIHVR